MTFSSQHDIELWLVTVGTHRYPVHARPGSIEGQSIWHVTPALDLTMPELTELIDHLSGFASYADGRHAYLPDISKVAVKAPGITPRFYHVGPSAKPAPTIGDSPVGDPIEKPEFGEIRYAKHVFHHLGLTDWATFKLIYSTIFSLMPAYLLRTMVPIDVGWCKIATLPVRANWKQILLAKFPGIALVRNNTLELLKKRLEVTDFAIESRKTDLLAVRKGRQYDRHHIRHGLEIIASDWWEDYSDKLELKRLKKASNEEYVAHVGGLIERNWDTLLEAFWCFLEATRRPAGNLAKGDDPGSVVLVPAWKVRGIDPSLHDHRVVHPVTSVPTGRLYPINQRDVGREASDLCEVSAVRQETEDVRLARPNAGGSSDESGRVLVLSPACGEDSRKTVLANSQLSQEGMA